ncbi:MAG: response regulator [Proteobacteria bacterium]|nr:response regulator [Pseudomonadota bacterium]
MSVKTILAIDDSRTIRQLVSQTLGDAGFSVTTAVDGADGVSTFQSNRFDAVITDINMPRLDGFGVIAAIRGGGANRKVPILVLTTESSPEFKDKARNLGATGWIVKPFEDRQLVDILKLVTGAEG